MSNLHYSFVMTFLNENYPNIIKEIDRNYMSDMSDISNVIDSFLNYHSLNLNDLIGVRYGSALKYRYKAIACILYLFQPSKLTSNERLSKHIAKVVKEKFNLDTDQLKRTITCVRNLFLYKDFKTDVIHFCNTYKILK